MKTKYNIIYAFAAFLFSINVLSGAATGETTIIVRPTHVYLQSDTAQGAFLISLSGYSTDSVRYRLFRSTSQYACWDNQTHTFITSASYSSGPLALGSPSGESTFWIVYQRGSNRSDTVSYRDRIGPLYSTNNNTLALPGAIAIKDSFIISGKLSGGSENSLTEKYVLLAWNGSSLVSATSSYIGSGEFSVYLPVGVGIDKIEVRTLDNQTLASRTGIWNTFVRLPDIALEVSQITELEISNIFINGIALNGFNPDTTKYIIELPAGTVSIPFVEATLNNPEALVEITQAVDLSDDETARTCTIDIVSEDGTTSITYTITFILSLPGHDATLSNLFIDAVPVAGFVPGNFVYQIILTSGTIEIPVVSFILANEHASAVVIEASDLNGSETERTTTIIVTSENGIQTGTYTILFTVYDPANDASLSDLSVDCMTVDGFNPDTMNYKILLPMGSISIPVVTCITSDLNASVHVNDATSLNGSEAERTTTIIVTAENGILTKTYSVLFTIYHPSDNALLSDLSVDCSTVYGFNPNTFNYEVYLPFGTIDVPVVTCITSDLNAYVLIDDATGLNGIPEQRTTTIAVTAEDGIQIKIYSIEFIVHNPANDASLSDLSVDCVTIDGFNTDTFAYTVLIPFETNEVPLVTCITNDLNASAIIIEATNLNGTLAERTTKIVVTAENGFATKTYSIIFSIYLPSGDASLTMMYVDGAPVNGFSAGNYTYAVLLPFGTTNVPVVSYNLKNMQATAIITNAGNLHGTREQRTTTVVVTAENGLVIKTYSIVFKIYIPSPDPSLAKLSIDGVQLNGFTAGNTTYAVLLPFGTTDLPLVTYTLAHENASAVITNAGNLYGNRTERTTYVVVTAENGFAEKTYSIVFNVFAPSNNASLATLFVNGTPVPGFGGGNLNYSVLLPFGTIDIPVVTFSVANEKATAVTTNAGNLNGDRTERTTTVIVKAENGITQKTYSITFKVYAPSGNASLTNLSVDGIPVYGFSAGNYSYAVLLPFGTTDIPVVSFTPAHEKASTVVVNASNLNGTINERTITVHVTAEDGTMISYKVVLIVDGGNGITKSPDSDLSLYPNPAVDYVTITGLKNVNRLEIMDLTGKVLRIIEVTGEELTVNISDLQAGIYILRTANQTMKFIKQ